MVVAATQDPVRLHHISQFTRKAIGWHKAALVMFYGAILTVLIGIVVFVFADRLVLGNDRIELAEARDKLGKAEDDLRELKIVRVDLAAAERLAVALPDAFSRFRLAYIDVADPLFEAEPPSIQTLAKTMDLQGLARCLEKMSEYQLLCEELEVAVLQEAFEDARLQLDDFLTRARSGLNTLLIIFRTAGDAPLFLTSEQLATLRDCFRERASQANRDRLNKAGRNLEDHTTEGAGLELLRSDRKVVVLEENVDLQRDRVAKLESQFDPNSLQALLPLLAMRIGAVVLLLFLTQILLSAYRYTTSLSTHFEASAFSLALAAAPGEFERLFNVLKPSDTRYGVPPSVISTVAELTKRGKE